jgi:mono/diheme cytochrome c family protein
MKTLLLILAMFMQQPPAANAPKGNAENGKTLFMKFGCYECHGREGQGAVTGPRLNQNPITFARFNTYIRKPSGEMPPYTTKVVSEQQAADIYAFLQSLPRPPSVDSIPLLK